MFNRILFIFIFIFCFISLEGFAGGVSGAHKPSVADTFYPFINFFIFVAILYYALKGKIPDFLRNRKESLEKRIGEAKELEKKSKDQLLSVEKKLAEIQKESDKIIETSRKQGELLKEKILSDARKYCERMVKDTKLAVQRELTTTRIELKNRIAELATKIAREKIEKNWNDGDEKRTQKTALGELNELR